MFTIEELEEKHYDMVFSKPPFPPGSAEIAKNSHFHHHGHVIIAENGELAGFIIANNTRLRPEYTNIDALNAGISELPIKVATWSNPKYSSPELRAIKLKALRRNTFDERWYDFTVETGDKAKDKILNKRSLSLPNTFEHEGRIYIRSNYDNIHHTKEFGREFARMVELIRGL